MALEDQIWQDCRKARLLMEDGKFFPAAQFIAEEYSRNADLVKPGTEKEVLFQFSQRLLAKNFKEQAAHLYWGENVFNTRPLSVRRIWYALNNYNQVSFIGSSGMGKTFCPIVFLALDFIEDPEYTTIKLISSKGSHADANARAMLATLWKTSLLPLPGTVTADYIGLDSNEKKFGIERICIPVGQDAKGSLRGKCHPFPRTSPHPKFGTHSRSRLFLDEDEVIPVGVWEEVSNVASAMDEKGSIKIIRSTNPKDKISESAIRNEPLDGWESIQLDGPYEWESKRGWHVVRLDAAMCENVVERKLIFPGLMTWAGYAQYLGNDDKPRKEYYSYARGFYPPQGVQGSIVSEMILNKCLGEFIYPQKTTPYAGVDTALEGGDDCVMTFGRVGKAIGWTDKHGKTEMFKESVFAIQVEQQIILAKQQTVDMALDIKAKCEMFEILPEHLAVDRTGNGAGVHDYLLRHWSTKVKGVDFGEKAEDVYILKEDTRMASEIYDGLCSQLWFQSAKLMESGNIKFGAQLHATEIMVELISRKYRQVGKAKRRVESKKDYKADGRKSPDHADSFTILVQKAKDHDDFTAAYDHSTPKTADNMLPKPGEIDKMEFISFDDTEENESD